MGRTAVSKHLAILKEADLVTARKVGRETRYRLNAYSVERNSRLGIILREILERKNC